MAGSLFSPQIDRDGRHAHQGRTAIEGQSQEGRIRDAGHLYPNYITLEFLTEKLEEHRQRFDILCVSLASTLQCETMSSFFGDLGSTVP